MNATIVAEVVSAAVLVAYVGWLGIGARRGAAASPAGSDGGARPR